eukprot:gene3394-13434_t
MQAPALRAVSNESGKALDATTGKQKVMQLLSEGYGNYNQGGLGPAVDEMMEACPVAKDELATKSFTLGQGTWEVFYAPHIARMSSFMGTQFTIQYKLEGSKLWSYVKYSNPVLGSGWLNSAGSMSRKYDDTVELKFDQFCKCWRGAFFPQFAVFPVLYLDEDICVFNFPPLNSNIAVKRIA